MPFFCLLTLTVILTPSYILIHDLISYLFSSHVTSHILPCFLLSLFERNFCILFLHISFVLSTTLPLCFCACSPIVLITVLVCDCIIVLAAYSLCYIPYCFINLPPPRFLPLYLPELCRQEIPMSRDLRPDILPQFPAQHGHLLIII